MKSHIFTLILIGILGAVPFGSTHAENTDPSIKEVKKETRDLLQAIGSYTADKKNEAVQKAKESLQKLDKRIDALEAKIDKNWDTMSDAARKQSRDNLKNLRKQRNKVAEWYGSMKTSSADAWDHMKNGFSGAYEALADAWEKSEKEFRHNE